MNPFDLFNELQKANKRDQKLVKAIETGNPASLVKKAKSRSSQRANTSVDNMTSISQLESMLGSYAQMPAPDISALRNELKQAIAAQYDPMIRNIKKDTSGAKKRAGSAKKDIGALYDELVGYYEGQVEPTKARTKQAQADASHNAAALKQSISGGYADRLQEQVDMYKNLGIESAVPSATEGQNADLSNMLAVAENTRAAEESALNIQGEGDIGYWSEGGGIANREGTEQQAVITQQLQQYLNEQNKQLSLLQGQKKAAYHSGLMELEQQAAQAQQQQQGQMWDRMLDLARLKLSAAGSGGGGGGSSNPGRGMTGALAFLQQSGAGGLGGTFQKYLAEASRWASTPTARSRYGGAVDTPEEWAQVIRDHAANQRQSPQNQDALWQAALRYYGRN